MRWVVSTLMAVSLCGCFAELLTTTAIQGELQAQSAQSAVKALNYAKGETGRTTLEHAIKTYQGEKGQYPPSLEALVPSWIASLPMQPNGQPYGYDPATGALLEGQAALGATPGDLQKIQQINAAVMRYGQTTGYYPPTLTALVPTYLNALPKTDSGQDFAYNNQNGAITHPSQIAGASPARARAGGAGAAGGPLGETMTGIQMQQDLGNMSNAGSAQAGGYARGGVAGIEERHNTQQEQALNNLGL